MKLVWLDRWIRTPGAGWKLPALCASSTIALMAAAAWQRNASRDFTNWTDAFILAAFGSASAVGAGLGVVSWRRLWRKGRTRAEDLVYDVGVRRAGIGLVCLMPLFCIALVSALGAEPQWGGLYGLVAGLSVMFMSVMLPVALWVGYIAGFRAAGEELRKPGSYDENNLPPPVCEAKCIGPLDGKRAA
jgi:hypothetical protein